MVMNQRVDAVGETIVIDETKNGPFQLKVRTGSATFIADEPIGIGGLGSGPNPYDLLSAALGTCSVSGWATHLEAKLSSGESVHDEDHAHHGQRG